MDKTFLYLSISGRDTPQGHDTERAELMEQLATLEGVTRDTSGQKGLPGVDLLAVEVAKAGLLSRLADAIAGWLIKDRRRALKLRIGDNELEISDMTEQERKDLVRWFQDQVEIQTKPRKK